jgi:hypothetical protein
VEASPPSQLKRFRLVGNLWRPPSDEPAPEDNLHLSYHPDLHYQYISTTQFARLLVALPRLECLSLKGVGRSMSQLSFSGVEARCLRQLRLPASPWLTQAFPTGKQLREIVSQFPLLEELSRLSIQARSEDGELTQADLDFFCSNATRRVRGRTNNKGLRERPETS